MQMQTITDSATVSDQDSGRALRQREVTAMTGLSRSTIWRLRRAGQFPIPRQLSIRVRGWLASDVAAWVRSRPFTLL
jgi:prophage regulatory protein